MLYARHKGIIQPRDHISMVSFDNVGNITFWRVALEPDDTLLAELNALLHQVRPEVRRMPRSAMTFRSTWPSPWWDR